MTTTDVTPFDGLKASLAELVGPASGIKVKIFQDAEIAINTAKNVKAFTKRIEDLRVTLVAPLNERVKAINAYAKSISQPLLDAETHLKSELVAFEREQEKIRDAERKRVAAEQAKAAEALRAKQEAERKAFAEQQEALQEAAQAFGSDTDVQKQVEQQAVALEEKQAQEVAVQQSETAGRHWDVDQQGLKNTRKTWKCELIDVNLVPKQFLIVTLNEKAVLAVARASQVTPEIPGVKLWQETSIALGANTYVPKAALR